MIPFILSELGVGAVVAVFIRPRCGTLIALQGIMLLAILGSAVGLVIHLSANLSFAQEIQPNATSTQLSLKRCMGRPRC